MSMVTGKRLGLTALGAPVRGTRRLADRRQFGRHARPDRSERQPEPYGGRDRQRDPRPARGAGDDPRAGRADREHARARTRATAGRSPPAPASRSARRSSPGSPRSRSPTRSGSGSLDLQAVTGLLAIARAARGHELVLSQGLLDGLDLASQQAAQGTGRPMGRPPGCSRTLLGFGLLGFTSVYREGFEVVLFLQNLRLRYGSGVVLEGVALGLARRRRDRLSDLRPAAAAAVQEDARGDRASCSASCCW